MEINKSENPCDNCDTPLLRDGEKMLLIQVVEWLDKRLWKCTRGEYPAHYELSEDDWQELRKLAGIV
jgi:hypothetical protein